MSDFILVDPKLYDKFLNCHWTTKSGVRQVKASYNNQKEAEDYLREAKLKGYKAYPCPICNKWHVGHKKGVRAKEQESKKDLEKTVKFLRGVVRELKQKIKEQEHQIKEQEQQIKLYRNGEYEIEH